MTDIVAVGTDLQVFNTQTSRAANILSIQIGSLEYEQDLGIDLKYFLSEDFRFQNESFKAYLVQVLANRGINVASVIETVDKLFETLTFNITAEEQTGSLVAR